MDLCDSNVWVALALSPHRYNLACRHWLETKEEPHSVVFCRATQQSFLRLLTNAAVLAPYGIRPLSNEAAWTTYDKLLADDRIVFHDHEPAGLETRWRQLASRRTASPKLWKDAYLAAYAITGSFRLVSVDSAFSQFQGLNLLLLS